MLRKFMVFLIVKGDMSENFEKETQLKNVQYNMNLALNMKE